MKIIYIYFWGLGVRGLGVGGLGVRGLGSWGLGVQRIEHATVAGHDPALQLEQGRFPSWQFAVHRLILAIILGFSIIQGSGPHPSHAPIRRITKYSVKLAPDIRIVIIFHLDSPNRDTALINSAFQHLDLVLSD